MPTAGKVIKAPQSTTLSEKMGSTDIVKLVCEKLLGHFADPHAQPMREFKHKQRQWKRTGVCYRKSWRGHEHLIEFYFFMNDQERGSVQMVGSLLNIDSFHHDPEDYIKGWVENMMKGFAEYENWKSPKLVDVKGDIMLSSGQN